MKPVKVGLYLLYTVAQSKETQQEKWPEAENQETF